MFLGLFSLEVGGRVLEASSLLALLGLPWVLVVCENTLLATLFFLEISSLLMLLVLLELGSLLHVDMDVLVATVFLEISSLLMLLVLLELGSLLHVDMDVLAVTVILENQQLADGAGTAGARQSSPRGRGRSGRHGVEQPAPGLRRGFRPLTGALSQARKIHRRAIESLNTSLVPHTRLFSLHPSLVSQNSSLSHGLGAMNSCGSMHGLCMHGNSSVMHDNSWGALEHNNSCSVHAAGVRGGTKAPSTEYSD